MHLDVYKNPNFNLFKFSRIITVQSSPDQLDSSVAAAPTSETDNGVNLYILAGHEAMQL